MASGNIASAGLTATAIASELSVCIQTVSAAIMSPVPTACLDEPRPAQPRKLTDLQVDK